MAAYTTVQMYGMQLTKRQQQILEFIGSQEHSPSLREIGKHFSFSLTTVVDHIQALKHKRALKHSPGRARSWQIVTPLDKLRSQVVDIPLFGSIPAGFAEEEKQDATGCISVDV
jgi:repressor LexA